MDTVGEGEGGKNEDSSTGTFTSSYVKQIANGKLLGKTGSSTRYSVASSAGGWGRSERETIYVYLCILHIVVWQKPIQYCKAIVLRLKINFLKKFKKSLLN